jgi:hypothetical protein
MLLIQTAKPQTGRKGAMQRLVLALASVAALAACAGSKKKAVQQQQVCPVTQVLQAGKCVPKGSASTSTGAGAGGDTSTFGGSPTTASSDPTTTLPNAEFFQTTSTTADGSSASNTSTSTSSTGSGNSDTTTDTTTTGSGTQKSPTGSGTGGKGTAAGKATLGGSLFNGTGPGSATGGNGTVPNKPPKNTTRPPSGNNTFPDVTQRPPTGPGPTTPSPTGPSPTSPIITNPVNTIPTTTKPPQTPPQNSPQINGTAATFINAPVSAAEGPPHVKMKVGLTNGRFVVYAALSHKDKVTAFRYEYGKDKYNMPGYMEANGDFTAQNMTVPVIISMQFNGRNCRLTAQVGFIENTFTPTCD